MATASQTSLASFSAPSGSSGWDVQKHHTLEQFPGGWMRTKCICWLSPFSCPSTRWSSPLGHYFFSFPGCFPLILTSCPPYCLLYKSNLATAHTSTSQSGREASAKYKNQTCGRDFFHKEMQLYCFQVHTYCLKLMSCKRSPSKGLADASLTNTADDN